MIIKLIKHKIEIFKWLIVVFSWLLLTFLFIINVSDLTIVKTNLEQKAFSVVTKTSEKMVFENYKYGELLKGEKLQGSFVADNNYLGQVLIRFYNFGRINTDSVIFRIKERDARQWFYENYYKTNQFQPNMYFTFGFPLINDSKGQKYDFEVESLDGQPDYAIGLSSVKPLGEVLYKYPKSLFISNPKTFIKFIVNNKIKKIEINGQTLVGFGIYINFIALSLFLINLGFDYLKKAKLNSFNKLYSGSIFLGIILLIVSAAFLYLKKTDLSFSVTTIAYFVLLAGVIFAIIDLKRNNR